MSGKNVLNDAAANKLHSTDVSTRYVETAVSFAKYVLNHPSPTKASVIAVEECTRMKCSVSVGSCGFCFPEKETSTYICARKLRATYCGDSFGDTTQLMRPLVTHTGGQS